MSKPTLDELIANYLAAIDAGEEPERERLMADHPGHAEGLREFFADFDRMRGAVERAEDEATREYVIGKESFDSLEEFSREDRQAGSLSHAETPSLSKLSNATQQRLEQLLQKLKLSRGIGILPVNKSTASFVKKEMSRFIDGKYKLLQQIGSGGMGEVWMAEQEKPVRRRVALKLIKTGMDTKEVVARFEAERQALAMMDHQHIAKVLDGGSTEQGRPYFVMELVQGIPITKYCDKNKLSVNERLNLFIPVCNAVQHAHQKGIIHRDLKPSNILVTLYDGRPVAKVIDFGLAKALQHQARLTDKTLFTEFGQVVGTLQYMSPEQAEMNALDIDTRTDIYSLGVILYELLTGSTPIDRDTLDKQAIYKVLETIRETDPPRPSMRLSSSGDAITGISQQRQIEPKKLSQILRGDLDWIVMKALEKDRTRRFNTSLELSEDLENFLNSAAVSARPPTYSYRLQRSFAQNRSVFLSTALIVLLLVAGLIGTGSMWLIAEKEAKRSGRAETIASEALEDSREAQEALSSKVDELERANYRYELQAAYSHLSEGDLLAASKLLDSTPTNLRRWEWAWLKAESAPHLGRVVFPEETKLIATSPNGNFAILVRESVGIPELEIVNAFDGSKRRIRFEGMTTIRAVAASKDARYLAVLAIVSDMQEPTAELSVWSAQSRQKIWGLEFSQSRTKSILTGFGAWNPAYSPLSISDDGQTVTAQGADFSKEQEFGYGYWYCIKKDGIQFRKNLQGFSRELIYGNHVIQTFYKPFGTQESQVISIADAQPLSTPNGFSDARILPDGGSVMLKIAGKWQMYNEQFERTDELEAFNNNLPQSAGLIAFGGDGREVVYADDNQLFVTDTATGYKKIRLGFIPSNTKMILANRSQERIFVYSGREILSYALPSRELVRRSTSMSFDDWEDEDKVEQGKYLRLEHGVAFESQSNGQYEMRDIATAALLSTYDSNDSCYGQAAAGIVRSNGEELQILSTVDGKLLKEVTLELAPQTGFKSIVVAADFESLCGVTRDGIGIWEISTGSRTAYHPTETSSIVPVAIRDRQIWILRNGSLDVLSPANGEWQTGVRANTARLSVDGSKLALTEGASVEVFAFPEMQAISHFDVPQQNVLSVSWGCGDSRLFIGGRDSVSICDVASSEVILTVPNISGYSTCLVAPSSGTTGIIGGQIASSKSWRERWPEIVDKQDATQLQSEIHPESPSE